jgi:Holliday junction resolvase
MRRAARTDLNHRTIVSELRAAGFAVQDTSQLGHGFPDLCISRGTVTALVEVKSKRGLKTAVERLGQAQKEFHANWKGWIITAFSTDDVLNDWRTISKRVGWSA